jgi:glycosyltransferase involved in cell wall biosynthesis
MSRVSLIAFWFPPSQQVGGRRALRFANHLARQGHAVTVYTVHPNSPGLANYTTFDSALTSAIDGSIRMVRTPSIQGFKVLFGIRDRLWPRRRTQARATGPERPDSAAPLRQASWPRRMVSALMDWLAVGDRYNIWIVTTLPVLVTRSILARPSAIWVTGPPWAPVLLAVLAGKILRVPVHLDFRDPWAQNPYKPAARVSAAQERWSVRNSQSVVANTSTMAQQLREAYPGLLARISAIYNGYDGWPAKAPPPEPDAAASVGGPFVVLHLGTVYPQRMPQDLAGLLARVAAEWTGRRPLRFRFVGLMSDAGVLQREFRTLGVEDALECPGQVSSEAVRRETAGADVLLLLQLGTPLQLPAKIFEYAVAGKPILCAADPNSETAVLIATYNLGKTVTDRTDSADALDYLFAVHEGRIQSGQPPSQFLADFNGEELAGRMAQVVLRDSGAR